jgi:protocatechuate 3,4-dioxygenase beta subunit
MRDDYRRFVHLSRRGFLVAGSMALSGIAAFPAMPACTLASEQEEGPYYIEDEKVRRDITEGHPGAPLVLAVRLVDARTCSPLRHAALDIWHCDALGVYSGFAADGGPGGQPGRGFGPPSGPPPEFGRGGPGSPRSRQTDPTRFLRGVQFSDERGEAAFTTLYPGWYSGRCVHVHIKVHTGFAGEDHYAGGRIAHTGQFFLPEDLTERIAHLAPYSKRLKVYRTKQEEDHVFTSQHGNTSMVSVERLGKVDADGFRASVTLAVNPEATPVPVGVGGRGPFGPPPPRRG